MSNKMREEFEEWAQVMGLDLGRYKVCIDYRKRETRAFFTVWQASRQALEIELPEEEAHKGVYYDIEYMDTDAVIEAIRSAGIRIKGK